MGSACSKRQPMAIYDGDTEFSQSVTSAPPPPTASDAPMMDSTPRDKPIPRASSRDAPESPSQQQQQQPLLDDCDQLQQPQQLQQQLSPGFLAPNPSLNDVGIPIADPASAPTPGSTIPGSAPLPPPLEANQQQLQQPQQLQQQPSATFFAPNPSLNDVGIPVPPPAPLFPQGGSAIPAPPLAPPLPMSHGAGPALKPPSAPVSHGGGQYPALEADAGPEIAVDLTTKEQVPVDALKKKFSRILNKKAKENGVIRIFLSSPFRGMEDERKQLVERHIPIIRDMCENAGVLLSVLDMRWGITDAQAELKKIILICLDSISESDIFVGFYGSRYGTYGLQDTWVQGNFDVANSRHSWIDDYRDKSITELEFRAACCGVVKSEPYKPSLVFFRDPAFDEAQAKRLQEAADSAKSDDDAKQYKDQISAYQPESEDSAHKLHVLSSDIAEACQSAGIGGVVNSAYASPRHGAATIAKCLEDIFEDFLPKGGLSAFEKEKASVLAHARARSFQYVDIGLEEKLGAQVSAAIKASHVLLVRGESGSGKTSLLSSWYMNHRDDPDLALVLFSVGVNASGSVTLITLLEYVNVCLGEHLGISVPFGVETSKPKGTYAAELVDEIEEKCKALAKAKRRVCIVLDALNQLEDDVNVEGMPQEELLRPFELWWLPEKLPKQTCYLVSSLDGPLIRVLEERNNKKLYMKPFKLPTLTTDDRRLIVEAIFKANGKTMVESLLNQLCRSDVGQSPLALNVISAEMLSFGEHFQLEQKLTSLCKARSIPELLTQVLLRLEDLFNAELPGVVSDTLRLVYASRTGVSELEMIRGLNHPLIVGSQQRPSVQMATWLPVYHAMRHLIVSRGGLFTFAHSHVRTAVFTNCMRTLADKKNSTNAFLEVVATYSSAQRQVQEKCLQRCWKHGVWKGLERLVGNNKYLNAACPDHTLNLQWRETQCSKLKDAGVKYLASGLARQNVLKRLILAGNDIGDDGVQYLCDLVRILPSLDSLSLEDNCITDDGALSLAAALNDQRVQLIELDVSNNYISGPGMVALASILRYNRRLQTLRLTLNDPLETTDAEQVANEFFNSLAVNTTLKYLAVQSEYLFGLLLRRFDIERPFILQLGTFGRADSNYFREQYSKRMRQCGYEQQPLPLAELKCYGNTDKTGSVVVGNSHQGSDRQHSYTLFVKLNSSRFTVSYVRFELHPSFAKFIQVVQKPPFELTLTGWGTFGVNIAIFFHEAPPLKFVWTLDFTEAGSELTYDLFDAHGIPVISPTSYKRYQHPKKIEQFPAPHQGHTRDIYLPELQSRSAVVKKSKKAPSKTAVSKEPMAISKSAPRKSAPMKSAPSKSAPTKMALMKSAPTKSAPTKMAPMKSAPTKSAPRKSAPMKSAPSKSAPTKMAPIKPAPSKSAPMKMAPMKPSPFDLASDDVFSPAQELESYANNAPQLQGSHCAESSDQDAFRNDL